MRRSNLIKRKQKKSKVATYIVSALVLFAVSLAIVFLKLSKLNKFVYVDKTNDGGAQVIVIDPTSDKIVKYSIDPDTVLKSARGLGEYKLSSLWILGEKEGYGGKLVAETVASNYKIPVYLWRNEAKTNLGIVQKMKIKSVFNKRSELNLDLSGTNFDLPNSILVNFVDEEIQESGVLVEVHDLTGDQYTIDGVSSILGTLGTKITGYTKGYDEKLDCEISGKNSKIVEEIAKIFDCKIVNNNEASADIRVRLGAEFANRF